MRRIQLACLAVISMVSLTEGRSAGQPASAEPGAQDKAAEEALRQSMGEAYKLVAEILDGRPVIVRVYPEPGDRPEVFQRVTVRLRGLSLRCDTVKTAFPALADNTPIVVLGTDQTDRAVTRVLADFMFSCRYKAGDGLALWPPLAEDPGHAEWEFVDALGRPLPAAAVEIALSDGSPESKIILSKDKLDGEGRLKRIKSGSSYARFLFTIAHPDYGTGTVEYFCSPGIRDAPETYVVPLVPMNSEAATRAIQGTVLDPQGRPVAGAEIWAYPRLPTEAPLETYGQFTRTAVTDEKGWFATYMPIDRAGTLSDTLIPAGSIYDIRITPDKSLNLAQYDGRLLAGTNATIQLPALGAEESFHTFAFEDRTGPITNPQELTSAVLTLWRDERVWVRLTYDQWKDGCSLPTGTLRAETTRWGNTFCFQPITLHAGSPQQLVFKEPPAIRYRGRVVNGATGEPMRETLVLVDSAPAPNSDPCALTAQQVQQWRDRAAQIPPVPPESLLYQDWGRSAITDAAGEYEIVFLPALRSLLATFTAVSPGYPPCSVHAGYPRPDDEGMVEVPTIRMTLPAGPAYVPTLVFENEAGPVTDPNKLKSIRIEVTYAKGRGSVDVYGWLSQPRSLQPGIYRATAAWDGKYYVFAPVDLREARPETVVFKPGEILDESVIYQGLVVDGATGGPIPRAVVIHDRRGTVSDMSRLTAEQWAAIESLGSDPDLTDPALSPLLQVISEGPVGKVPKIVLADAQGWFRIALSRGEVDRMDRLLVVKQGFLGTEQLLTAWNRPGASPSGALTRPIIEPDKNGLVTFPPLRLFPAGILVVEPVLPAGVSLPGMKPHVSLHLPTTRDDPTPWLKDYWATPNYNHGASVVRPKELRADVRQSVYVPAGVSMTVLVYDGFENAWAPHIIRGISVPQGQVLDLGRLELSRGVEVIVKVVDTQGNPVKGMRVSLADEQAGLCGGTAPTGTTGKTRARLPPASRGKFVVSRYGGPEQPRLEESTPYEVGGPEDAGREFVLTLSDTFLEQLLGGQAGR